jgi:hypothetical protein
MINQSEVNALRCRRDVTPYGLTAEIRTFFGVMVATPLRSSTTTMMRESSKGVKVLNNDPERS